MATGLLLDKRLSVRTLRDSRIVVDEAACTGATFATLLNPDGDGKNYRLGTWLVSGYLAVLAPGIVEGLVVGGGGGAGSPGQDGGACGWVVPCRVTLAAGRVPVTVGPGGAVNVAGTASSIGSYISAQGGSYNVPGTPTSVSSRITGSSGTYGGDSSGSGTPANSGAAGASPSGGWVGCSGVVYVRWEI